MTDSTTAEQGADHGEEFWVERKAEDDICSDLVGLKPDTDYHVRVNGGDEAVMTTKAEEPIEDRLRRAWLNGFKEGVDRSAYAATEATGRWDY